VSRKRWFVVKEGLKNEILPGELKLWALGPLFYEGNAERHDLGDGVWVSEDIVGRIKKNSSGGMKNAKKKPLLV